MSAQVPCFLKLTADVSSGYLEKLWWGVPCFLKLKIVPNCLDLDLNGQKIKKKNPKTIDMIATDELNFIFSDTFEKVCSKNVNGMHWFSMWIYFCFCIKLLNKVHMSSKPKYSAIWIRFWPNLLGQEPRDQSLELGTHTCLCGQITMWIYFCLCM